MGYSILFTVFIILNIHFRKVLVLMIPNSVRLVALFFFLFSRKKKKNPMIGHKL